MTPEVEAWLEICTAELQAAMAGKEIALPDGTMFVCPDERWFTLVVKD